MAQGSAIRAGRAFVELFTKDGQLVAGLRRAQARVGAFGAAITGMGTRMLGLGAALGAPLLAAAGLFSNMGDDIAKAAQRIGITVEALSELRHAAELSGATAEELENGFRTMSRTVGSGGLPLDQRLEQIAEELRAIEDPALRAARAQEIFGRAGTRLLPLLMSGAAGIQAMRQEAHRLGLVISTEDATAAEAFNDALGRVWSQARRLTFQIGAALAPALQRVAETLTQLLAPFIRWLGQNRELVQVIGLAVAGLTGIGLVLLILGPAISAVAAAFGFVATMISVAVAAIGMLAGAVVALLTPLGLVLLALDTLRGYLVVNAVQGTNALQTLGSGFRELGQIVQTTWGGVVDALATGDLESAGQMAMLGLQTAWASGLATMRSAWRDFRDFFVDVFWAASYQVARIFVQLGTSMTSMLFDLIAAFNQVAEPLGLNLFSPEDMAAMQGAIGNGGGGILGTLDQMEQEERDLRRQHREAANRADREEVDRLQRELDALRERIAGDRSWRDFNAMWDEAEFGVRPRTPGADQMRTADIAGSFSARALGGMGIGRTLDRQQEMVREQQRGNRLLADIRDAVQDGAAFA